MTDNITNVNEYTGSDTVAASKEEALNAAIEILEKYEAAFKELAR